MTPSGALGGSDHAAVRAEFVDPVSVGDNKQPLWATALASLSVVGVLAFAFWLYRAVTAAPPDEGESEIAEVVFPPIDFAPLVEGWVEGGPRFLDGPELANRRCCVSPRPTARALRSLELLDGDQLRPPRGRLRGCARRRRRWKRPGARRGLSSTPTPRLSRRSGELVQLP